MKQKDEWKMLRDRLETYKMVAAIKDPKYIERAVQQKDNLSAVLLMTGTILTVNRFVDFIQSQGLPVILHVEKIGGLQMDNDGIEFIKQSIKPAAIVTTKTSVIKKAKASGLHVIQRVFLIDTDVYTHLEQEAGKGQILADMIELMPCRAPDLVARLADVSPVPVLTGGLLRLPAHAKEALEHGAIAVTTSNVDMWKVDVKNLAT